MNVSVEGLPRLFAQLEKDNFFGTLSFQFRAGQIVLIRREETLCQLLVRFSSRPLSYFVQSISSKGGRRNSRPTPPAIGIAYKAIAEVNQRARAF